MQELIQLASKKGFKARTITTGYTENYYLGVPTKIPQWITPICDSLLLSEIQKWLREKYGQHLLILPTETMYWTYKILNLGLDEVEQAPYKNVCAYDYSSYEEALEAGILEALKSIEDVHQQ